MPMSRRSRVEDCGKEFAGSAGIWNLDFVYSSCLLDLT